MKKRMIGAFLMAVGFAESLMLSAVAGAPLAEAPVWTYSTNISQLTNNATRIARIHIIAHERFTAGATASCGYLYTANVVTALKGDNTTFRFLAPNASDFMGFDRDYLIFAFKTTKEEFMNVGHFYNRFTEAQYDRLYCMFMSEYYVSNRDRTIFALTKETEKSVAVEWLMYHPSFPRENIDWCIIPPKPSGDANRSTTLVPESGSKRTALVAWDAVKETILAAVQGKAISCQEQKIP